MQGTIQAINQLEFTNSRSAKQVLKSVSETCSAEYAGRKRAMPLPNELLWSSWQRCMKGESARASPP